MAALLGILAGIGLFLIFTSFVPSRGNLATQLAAVNAVEPTGFAAVQRLSQRSKLGRIKDRLQADLIQRLLVPHSLHKDLTVLGITPAQHAWSKVTVYLVALVIAPAAGVLGSTVGLPLGFVSAFAVFVVCALIGATFDKVISAKAHTVRRDFLASMAAYLDLVAMLVAGRAHINTALRVAAGIADGPGWHSIRRHLADARLNGHGEVHGIRTLGIEWQVPAVVEFGHQVETIDVSGAHAADSLRARAEALRRKDNAEALGLAKSKTSMLDLSNGIIAAAFLLMIMFPTVTSFLSN